MDEMSNAQYRRLIEERDRKEREERAESRRAYDRLWELINPHNFFLKQEKKKAHEKAASHKRRALLRGNGGHLTAAQWLWLCKNKIIVVLGVERNAN